MPELTPTPMLTSFFRRHRLVAILSLIALAMPYGTAEAVTASKLLPSQDSAMVSRGNFLRAAVKALNLDVGKADESILSEYVRVATGFRPYAAVAHKRDALRVFGSDLRLSRGITRGEAVRLVTKLGNFDPVTSAEDFRDVTRGTVLEGAVGTALLEDWLRPLRNDLFGTDLLLQEAEALRFITILLGEEAPIIRRQRETEEVQTIRINLKSVSQTSPFPKADILQTLWQIIDKNYLYQDKINADDLAYDAAEAMMESLDDPYSVFMRPDTSQQFQTQIQGEVTGIGAQVEYKSNILTIVTPLRGSPAETAGLKPGDKILAVNGESIVDIGFGEAVGKVRGLKGSIAELTIQRDDHIFTSSVKRDVIKVPEIDITWQGNIAIVRLLQFGAVTDDELRTHMTKVQAKNPAGIILDLRNNPGGLLHAASNVMSNFVEKGSAVAIVQGITGERTEYTEHAPIIAADVPLVVLINGGSASASEIVAGALQDLKRATLMGEKSFGKGTVQQVLQFNDQSAVKMTVAEWLTPKGRQIDGIGVEPDLEVETDNRDSQMSAALNLLRNKIRRP